MKKERFIFGFIYFLLGIIFYFGASYVINAVRMSAKLTGANFIWVFNLVALIFGVLLGLPRFVKVLINKGEKKILLHRFIYIIPIVLFEIWFCVPELGYPYANKFLNSFINELLCVLIGFSLITMIGIKDETA